MIRASIFVSSDLPSIWCESVHYPDIYNSRGFSQIFTSLSLKSKEHVFSEFWDMGSHVSPRIFHVRPLFHVRNRRQEAVYERKSSQNVSISSPTHLISLLNLWKSPWPAWFSGEIVRNRQDPVGFPGWDSRIANFWSSAVLGVLKLLIELILSLGILWNTCSILMRLVLDHHALLFSGVWLKFDAKSDD